MGRKREQFSQLKAYWVEDYLERKLATKNWPSESTQREAAQDLKKIPVGGQEEGKALFEWCTRWLTPGQWRSLRGAMRQWHLRSRESQAGKQVTLTNEAWQVLSSVAIAEGKTLSGVIVERLEIELGKDIQGNGQ